LARRVLRAIASDLLCPALSLVIALSSCRREEHAPAPSASAAALGNEFAAQGRERHLQEELARARARFQANTGLSDCAKSLQEKADLELCQAARAALAVLTAEPATSTELALGRLAPAALALARLSQRLRYLSLAELAERRSAHDAGAPPPPAASAMSAPATPAFAREGKHPPHIEQRALVLGESPVTQLMELSIRSERDVLRNIGAYLEYGPLPVRRAAFDNVERLRAVHPDWPLLTHLLQEAAVLESDAVLKGDLRRLSASGARSDQSAGTK